MDIPSTDSPADQEPLAYRAARGGLWVAFGSYFTIGCGFLANLILTRLLLPEHYGIYSLGVFFFSLINLQPKLGVGYAFGQRQDTTGELIGTHLILDVIAGGATLLLVLLAAMILPAFGYSGDVVMVMFVLALNGVMNCLGNTAFLLLEKSLYFRQTTLLSGLAVAVSYLPAFGLALRGGGYWSLIAQSVVNTALMLIGVWWLARRQLAPVWRLRWRFDRAIAEQLLRFGIVAGLGGMFGMFAMSFDNFLIGTFVGVGVLGFYDRAYRLAEWPNKLVTSVVTRTAFYTYARLQNDAARLQKTATMLTWLIAVATIPLALVLFAIAPDLVLLLYGERWLPSAVFLRLLVVYSLIRPLLDNAGSLFVSTGHPRRATIVSAAHAAALLAAATPLTLAFGAIGTCVGVGIAFVAALALAWLYARRAVALAVRDTLAVPIVAAALTMAATLALTISLDLSRVALIARLALQAGWVTLAFGVALFALQPRQLVERARYVWRLLRASQVGAESYPS